LKATALIVNKDLWAFYSASTELPEAELRATVTKVLPYYAVPCSWKLVPSIPLTANGKVDKGKLKGLASNHYTEKTASLCQLSQDISSKSSSVLDLAKKNEVVVTVKELDNSMPDDLEAQPPALLPPENGSPGARWLRHRFFSIYRRLFSVIFFANLAVAIYLLHKGWSSGLFPLPDLGTATAANLLTAILIRQDHVVNIIFLTAAMVPTWVPLAIRRHFGKVYHLGGVHSGAAVAAVLWFSCFLGAATREYVSGSAAYPISVGALIISYLILSLLLAILTMAHPTLRRKFHNHFELVHRFCGWTALALVWVQTILLADSLRGETPLGKALLQNPGFWLIAIATASIIYPWLWLRKVNVRPEVLSKHAIRLYFDYCTAGVGTGIRIATNPLLEWHAFAAIPKPGVKGFSIIVSNAGDWTKATIENAPTRIWKRGLPAAGVLTIAPLFKKIVLVATGSGIGPCLPVIMAKRVPCRIIWSTPDPVETFGQGIIDVIFECDPQAIIHNTRTAGRPDLPQLAYSVYKASSAEAVCVISNQKLTEKVVYEMESRGVPAYGPVWDS
jgi:hypothetical protein